MTISINPTFNSKLSQQIDIIKKSLDHEKVDSIISGGYNTVCKSVLKAILLDTDSSIKLKNFITDYLDYTKNHFPEIYYVMLLVLTLRKDDLSKGINDDILQRAAIDAFLSMSNRYSVALSMKKREYQIEKYLANVGFYISSFLRMTLQKNEAFQNINIDEDEREVLISKGNVFTINALKYMVKNNVPYLWKIIRTIPIDNKEMKSFDGHSEPVKDTTIFQQVYIYSISSKDEGDKSINPNCVEIYSHTTESFQNIIESISQCMTNDYAMNDIHSVFMLQKHLEEQSSLEIGREETIRCASHVGLAIVYYYEVLGQDIADMLSDEYIKFLFSGDLKNNIVDDFIILHNCIEYLNNKYEYSNNAIKVLRNFRNYLKLRRAF